MLGCGFGCNHSAQKHGCHIPLVTVIGDHSDCFSVASGHDAGLGIMTLPVLRDEMPRAGS